LPAIVESEKIEPMLVTFTVDTSVLERAIPEIVAFGRRTKDEQCVTSAGIIIVNAQDYTAAVAVGTIEADLEIEVSPAVLKSGRLSKNKKRQREIVSVQKGVRVPVGVLIIMARTNPGSKYNKLTGSRWALDPSILPSGPGSGEARRQMIANLLSRMAKARFSSTHFLQHGWTGAIRILLGNPNFKGWATKYQGGSRPMVARRNVNPLNTMDPAQLGTARIMIAGDVCEVVAENAIGDEGNAVLSEKHRDALILYGTPPLQMAVDQESAALIAKMSEYLDRGFKQQWGMVL
jgi:hypothetical protein